MRHAPARIDSRGRAKPLRRHTKPRKPKQVKAQALEVLACFTRERIRDGMRRYIVTFIDPVSHFAFAVGLPSKHARYTARALEQGLSLLPQRPTTVLSDNGSKFKADFAQLLKERGIKRWYTYPKTPKMNAHAERFNRTIQESFVDDHEELLFTDLALFNRKLADWLVFYNTERPHHSLGQLSPLSFLMKDQPECQRYWTHTRSCHACGMVRESSRVHRGLYRCPCGWTVQADVNGALNIYEQAFQVSPVKGSSGRVARPVVLSFQAGWHTVHEPKRRADLRSSA
jgi:hypothetical protein